MYLHINLNEESTEEKLTKDKKREIINDEVRSGSLKCFAVNPDAQCQNWMKKCLKWNDVTAEDRSEMIKYS